ncbi:uncharacterized protein LOC26529899 isoform X2 [Drosophila willistoni]|uniref:uncharacterized protein LOC26529899 isoform X2 n=1 Tax=Drosophila willistoni TaxID=7260 RepID=UPI001F086D65|nr:uncharacterized protein LOC26529899 isoform X2 [Drosophila willistoni]
MDTPDKRTSATETFGHSTPAMKSNDQLLSTTTTSSGSISSSSNSSSNSTELRAIEKFCTDLDKLPDVPEIDAFKRGHQVETLLDMFENNFGEQYLYIKFENLVEPELVPLNVAVKNVGHLLPRFYKDYLKAWNKWEEQKAKN